MMTLFYICSISYILCEFYLRKEKGKFKDVIVKRICLVITSLILALPIINKDIVYLVLIYAAIYFLEKLIYYPFFKRNKNSNSLFFTQHILHFTILLVLIYIKKDIQFEYYPYFKEINSFMKLNVEEIYKCGFTVLLIMNPSNMIIQNIIGNYKPNEDEETNDNRIGRKIGSIERLIMLIFIALDQYAAMGLVLTAKSIARYDKISKDKVFAEYYLLGTLLSTLIVVIVKILFF